MYDGQPSVCRGVEVKTERKRVCASSGRNYMQILYCYFCHLQRSLVRKMGARARTRTDYTHSVDIYVHHLGPQRNLLVCTSRCNHWADVVARKESETKIEHAVV